MNTLDELRNDFDVWHATRTLAEEHSFPLRMIRPWLDVLPMRRKEARCQR